MYFLALILGITSYLVFLLGVVGKLSLPWLTLPLLIFSLTLVWQVAGVTKQILPVGKEVYQKWPWLARFGLGLFLAMVIVNLLGLLAPEISFDALWYHLTLPKLYLHEGHLQFFKGGLLYYSAMPQTMEMIYLLGLAFSGQLLARFFHFMFGLLTAVAVFNLAKRFLKLPWALLASFIFYTQLVIGWLSAAAYVDLTRTFLEVVALTSALIWLEKRKSGWLALCGAIIGIASSVKLISLASALVLFILILAYSQHKIKDILIFTGELLIAIGPWLAYGYKKTGILLYPFLTNWFWQTQTAGLGIKAWFLSRTPIALASAIIKTAFTKEDILSPIYLISLPLWIKIFPLLNQKKIRFLWQYILLTGLIWFLTPLNYNRFLLPYTPAIIILMLRLIQIQKREIKITFISASLFIALVHLGIRGMSNGRVIEFLAQPQATQAYLQQYLPAKLGNFGQAADFLVNQVGEKEKVLVVGSHNLFYFPVNFDHESWAEPGIKYKYILTQGKDLPKGFGNLPIAFVDPDAKIVIYDFDQTLAY